MTAFLKKYKEEVLPGLSKAFGKKNILSLPKIEKVVINVCLGANAKDAQFASSVEKNLIEISGQKPQRTVAKQAVSNFKLREGMFLGYKVTLRGKRMYDFIEKLVYITLPRVRDFSGLSIKNIDGQGNLNIGLKEQLAFTEISPEGVERLHGLEITLVTSTTEKEEGIQLFNLMGFPFKELKDNE